MIIGGASIYQQTISQANRMILTFIDLKTPEIRSFLPGNTTNGDALNRLTIRLRVITRWLLAVSG